MLCFTPRRCFGQTAMKREDWEWGPWVNLRDENGAISNLPNLGDYIQMVCDVYGYTTVSCYLYQDEWQETHEGLVIKVDPAAGGSISISPPPPPSHAIRVGNKWRKRLPPKYSKDVARREILPLEDHILDAI